MQLTQKYWTLFFAFFLTHTIYAQTVEYDISFDDSYRIEKDYLNGALKVSLLQDGTIQLDSISPNGDVYHLTDVSVADSSLEIREYLFDEQDGVYVSYSFPDTNYPNTDCKLSKVKRIDINSNMVWESDFNEMPSCNLWPGKKILMLDGHLIFYGWYKEESDCSPPIKFFEIDRQSGQFILDEMIGYCSVDISRNNTGYTLVFFRNCSCNESNGGAGDHVVVVDDSLNFLTDKLLETNNFIDNNGKDYVSVSTEKLFPDLYFSHEIKNRIGSESYKGVILDKGNDLVWINVSDSLGLNNNSKTLYDVVPYDTFLLFLFGKSYSTLLQYGGPASYDSTELNIVCTSKDLTQVGNIWTEIKPGYILKANIKHSFSSPSVGNLFIKYGSTTGTTSNPIYHQDLERISFNSIINSVERELKSNELTFEVYPNPTLGEISIETTNSGKLVFYDLAGKRQLASNINTGSNKLEINQLPAGVYFLVLTTEDGNRTTQKLIIQ